MKKIVIIGARKDGHAKVVLEIILAEKKYKVVGFIDDDLYNKNIKIRNIPVVGRTEQLHELKKKYRLYGGIAAIGNNSIRRNLAEKIKTTGLNLINAIHPTVHIDSDVIYGEGNYFGQGVIIITGTKIGNCVNIHTGATIDHDNTIEDGANIGPGSHTAGRVKICRDAFIGTGTSVIPDIIIGEGTIVGAGSVIIRNIAPFTKVVGNPARIIGKSKKRF